MKQTRNPLISIAPMMDWTDRHCRFFHRLLAPNALLYTEMVTAPAILHGDKQRLLGFNEAEHPVILQLGGSDPQDLAASAKIGEDYGYDGINLNCGCPSPRVQKGAFGACLMAEPVLVADCIAAMRAHVQIPVSVKCRIGIDDMNERNCLWHFIETVSKAGCTAFTVHARKAWLKGLSPKENREVPPLDYALVTNLKKDFPAFSIELNGGITTVTDAQKHLETFDSVMIGRAAYQNPDILIALEAALYNTTTKPLPDIIETMIEYADAQRTQFGTPLNSITRHMLGLNNGKRGARRWRQILTVDSLKSTNPRDVMTRALNALSE
jgi:tRNA-dihydrouridine synthase A